MIPFDRRKIGLFIRKKDSEVSFLSVTRVETDPVENQLLSSDSCQRRNDI